MSDEEQMAAIGRLHMERASASRELVLAQNELKRYSEQLQPLASHLARADDPARMEQAASLLHKLTLPDGLSRITQLVADVQRLTQRLQDISQTLRNAGAL